ncbi:phage tail assembly chaperone G [Desulfoscipio geothermicus]|uniref:Phage tail assembly chaperone protein, TAC n=1 Tax=Desulfoscipio geothermicus DSM 3669 TaxID=1121426 RepID=A0A1I6EGC0_9FIRM|nr:hypothetical protein [Desulfoscipio geothermicus]SFR16755.1 hypothetical protein SAMN05660706_1422 [Desulfoscipio geothermicus DSM 3669]
MNQLPQITINGKKYTMPKPKIKLWRHLIKFNEARENGELEGEKMLDEMIDLVVIAFNNPDVTKEAVEENVGFEELAVLFTYINQHVSAIAGQKAAQFPNGKTPAGT